MKLDEQTLDDMLTAISQQILCLADMVQGHALEGDIRGVGVDVWTLTKEGREEAASERLDRV